MNFNLSRSSLQHMIKRRDVPTLAKLARRDAEGNEKPKNRPFKDYKPGYVHIDIKPTPNA